MDNKKKFHGLLKLLLPLLFTVFFVTFSSTCNAVDKTSIVNTGLDNNWLSTDSMYKIMTGLKVNSYSSGDYNFLEYYCYINNKDITTDGISITKNFANIFNDWFNNYSYNNDVTLENILFSWAIGKNDSTGMSAETRLTVNVKSGGSIYVTDVIPYMQLYEDGRNISNYYTKFKSWNYTNNVITSASTSSTTETTTNIWALSETNMVLVQTLNSTAAIYPTRYNPSNFYILNDSPEKLYTTTFAPLKYNGYKKYFFDIAYRYTLSNNQLSYNADSLNYYIDIGVSSGDIPTPTPVPTGSGGGSTDLTQTNSLIQDVQDALITEYNPENVVVSSGDITSALGFDLMTDRYSNFWLTLTQNLTDALSSNVRIFTFTSPFNNSTIIINLDNFPIRMPTSIRWLISTITSFGIIIIIVRYSHDIYIKITSGNVDEVLAMNEDSGIIDLF